MFLKGVELLLQKILVKLFYPSELFYEVFF